MDLKFQPDLELFTSVRGKRLLWIFTLFFVLMPVSGYAQREAKEQKIKNTEALRRVLINLARWDLSIVAERQKVQEDWARLRPKLLLSERRAFDEAFAPIQKS